jgi:hypothetical protein
MAEKNLLGKPSESDREMEVVMTIHTEAARKILSLQDKKHKNQVKNEKLTKDKSAMVSMEIWENLKMQILNEAPLTLERLARKDYLGIGKISRHKIGFSLFSYETDETSCGKRHDDKQYLWSLTTKCQIVIQQKVWKVGQQFVFGKDGGSIIASLKNDTQDNSDGGLWSISHLRLCLERLRRLGR